MANKIHGGAFALASFGVAAFLLVAGCSDRRDANKRESVSASAADEVSEDRPHQPAASGERDARTQHDLAADIKRAETARADDADMVWNQVRRDYHGKRLTWTVFYSPILCPAADKCHVMPFDRTGADKKIVQGWMPRLDLSADAFATLHKTCAEQKRCQFRFTGTLDRLTLSAEHLTALTFTDVQIVAAR